MAADRQIGFVQQQPGHLDLVTMIHSGKKTVVIVHRFGERPSESMHPITTAEFDEIWTAFTSADASRYAFTPSASDGMSDSHFYTIKITGAEESKALRIPMNGQTTKPVSEAVTKIEAWIDEKKG